MNKKSNGAKNDGERLYEFTQKLFKLLSEIGDERKKSREDWNNEVITRKQHHRNITNLYIKAVAGTERILRWELATIITEGVMSMFQEKESELFDKMTLQKGKELHQDLKPLVEHVQKINKELDETKSNLDMKHKPFASLDKFKVS